MRLQRAEHIEREAFVLVLDPVCSARIEKLDVRPTFASLHDERRPPLAAILVAFVIRPNRPKDEHATADGVGGGEGGEVGAGGRGCGRLCLLDLWRVADRLALLLDDSTRLRDQFDNWVEMVGT